MNDIAPIRDAATLLLVREVDRGLEVFMVERPGAADFGGMHVFPGGKVDAVDSHADDLCDRLDDAEASRRLGLERGGLAYWVAAIRESFEEAGALLGCRSGELIGTDDGELASFDDYRRAVHAGELNLIELCDRESLTLATDRVHYFSHWITPVGPPRRYNTRFFLTVMPDDQDVAHHEDELEDGVWISPREALANFELKRWMMIHPTLITLESLARYADYASLVADVLVGKHLPEVTPELHRQGMQYSAF